MSELRRSIVLVGFQDQGNLGLGYLAGVLIAHGYDVRIVDIKERPGDILRHITEHPPLLVGLSLIFQYYVPRYASLASFLRIGGVSCHLTAGGHYPSLCHEQTMNQIPELDSIVLFEGEETLLELVNHLACSAGDWRQVQGIAYREDGQVVLNPPRPLIVDLDTVPFPYRAFGANKVLGKEVQPLLATRGCPRSCAFCSIREFYGRAPGKIVRRRSPENTVREMRQLYTDRRVSIFLFQDDDFPLLGATGRRWVYEFVVELKRQGLLGKVIWKISCRVDEVDAALFAKMKEAGLYLVYLGIESGTASGLATLNKQTTVADNLRAVATVKDLGLMYGYGFMLFDPGSTFASVRENIRFLRQIVGDGSAAATFCKMLPYAGTPIEKELANAGRLKGSIAQPDYEFLDPMLDVLYEKVTSALAHWIHGPDAVVADLTTAWHEVAILKHLFTGIADIEEYESFLRTITRECNERVFQVVEEASLAVERTKTFPLSVAQLREEARGTSRRLIERRDAFVYRNQDRILADLARQPALGEVIHRSTAGRNGMDGS